MDNQNINETLEISLADLIDFFKRNIRFIILATFIAGVIGLLYSFTLTRTYTAQTIVLPEYKLAGSGSFFSMAFSGGGSGFDGAERLAPELYPNILATVPFGQHLLQQPMVDFAGNKYASYLQYLKRDSLEISLRSRLLSIFKSRKNEVVTTSPVILSDTDILNLSGEEVGYARAAFSPIVCNVDSKTGTIIISAELDDPVVGAELVEVSKKYLVNYVEDYRSSKLNQNTLFLTERLAEAKRKLREAEFSLQSYRDRNRDSYLNVSRIQEQQLQSDYVLAQSIHSDLSQRLEQAKIKEKEEKPVFKVLEPTRVPLEKSGPNRKIIGIVFAAIGGFLALLYIVFKKEKLHHKLM